MQCPNCHTKNPPQAKYCLECGNRLVVCPNCGTVNLPIAKFCIECGTPLRDQTATTAMPVPPPAASSSGMLDGSSDPVVLLPAPEERRIVTVMFADITGSTPLADRLDPEDMRAILTGYFNLMTEQIRKHDGTVEKYIGDAVMAVFGLPLTHEDDPDRAIRAALDMQSALARFNEQRLALDPAATRLQMRIGINTGEVAAPGATAPQRQDFLITGDAVNIAARLQQMATPDTILVGERTYLSTRDLFDFRALAPLTLKGKPEPVCAYVVLDYHDPSSMIAQRPRGLAGRSEKVPLIGRTLELTFLHTSYALVLAERHPHLITILGEPGVGKSRLVHEFIAREQERVKSASAAGTPVHPLVLRGRCPPYGEGITYWPLIEILRSLIGVREHESDNEMEARFLGFVKALFARTKRTESPEEITNGVLRRIGRGLNEPLRAGKDVYLEHLKDSPPLSTHHTKNMKQSETQVALLRSWRVLIEALAEEQPLILVIDDLQWADEALLEFLEYLTERISNVPVFLLCPARPDFFEQQREWGGGKRNFTTLELESLTREESSELVDALLSTDDLPEALRNTILTRAEGNPFFVEEIIRMFIDQGILVAESDPEQQKTRWHVRSYHELVSEYATIGEQEEDSVPGALESDIYGQPLPRIPDTIQGVLAARVDLLNPTEKLVLQNAAIIGRTFWLSALQELSPDLDQATIQAALTALDRRDFIVEIGKQARGPLENDQTFVFKHILIRGVVYNNIPRIRRSQAHAHLASWLEKVTVNRQETFVGLLAYHYQQALATWSTSLVPGTIEFEHTQEKTHASEQLTRDELRRRTIMYLTLAGDQAMNSYYTGRAIQAYSDALDLMREDETSPEASYSHIIKMHIKLGDAHFQRFDVDEAWQEYRLALRIAQEEHVHIEDDELLALYERLALLNTRWCGGFDKNPDPQEIRSYIDIGLVMLKGKPMSRAKAAFVTYLAFWYIRQLETASYAKKAELAEQAETCVHEALGYAEELNDPSLLSLVLDATSFVYSQYHKYEEAHRLQHRRLQLESQLTAREELYDLYYSLGYTHEAIADYASALMWFGRAWTCAQSMENPALLLSCTVKRMRMWRQWNRWAEARQVALDILRFIEQYQQCEKEQLWALETLAVIAYRTGNAEEGDQYTRQYKRLIERQGDNDKDVASASMHSIHLACEDWQQATADYQEKLRTSEPLPSPEVVSTLAELLVTTGEGTAAVQEQTCERAITLSETSRARKSMIIALRARGRLYTEQCEWQKAENDLRTSLRMCEELDLPWERGNTLYYLGMLYKRRAVTCPPAETRERRDDEGRARYYFEQALGFFESLNAAPAAQRARMALTQDVGRPEIFVFGESNQTV
jgi:predicted ATPase/class 3 adenylate cyclase